MVRRAELDIVITGDEADLRRAVNRVNKELAGVGRTTLRTGQTITRSMGRGSGASMAIRNASFQFGDLAVQMAAGTSASRALAMQLPQLLGGFGTLGAVLGAVAAVAFPVATAMRNISREGGNVTSVFGTLQPLAEGIATAFSNVAALAVQMGELVVNNLDRIIITAGVAAGLLAGKFVAGFVAARAAAFTFAGALTAVRTALIRTGIGAMVVALGEGIYRFTQLAQAAGGYGEAVSLIGDIFTEVWDRMKQGISLIGELFDGLGMFIMGVFQSAFGFIDQKFRDLINSIIDGINSVTASMPEWLGGGGDPIDRLGDSELAGQGAYNMEGGRAIMGSAAGSLGNVLTGPLQSVQRIRDLLASIQEDRIDLPSLLGVNTGNNGDGEGGAGGAGGGMGQDLGTYLDGLARNPAWDALIERFQQVQQAQEMTRESGRATWSALGTFIQQFAGKSKAAAIAAIAIQKGLSISQIIANTAAAQMRALAELGPIAGPPAAAKIGLYGKIQAALVAATGLAQAASAGGGGGRGGGPNLAGGGGAGPGSAQPSRPAGPAVSLTLIGEQGFTRAQIVQIAEALNDSNDEGQRIDIRGTR